MRSVSGLFGSVCGGRVSETGPRCPKTSIVKSSGALWAEATRPFFERDATGSADRRLPAGKTPARRRLPRRSGPWMLFTIAYFGQAGAIFLTRYVPHPCCAVPAACRPSRHAVLRLRADMPVDLIRHLLTSSQLQAIDSLPLSSSQAPIELRLNPSIPTFQESRRETHGYRHR